MTGRNNTFNDSILSRRALGPMNATGEPLQMESLLSDWQANISGLELRHNHVYYAMLYVSNDAQLEVSCISPGVRIDLTGPDISEAIVKDVTGGILDRDTDFACLDSIHSLVIAVGGGVYDLESGNDFTYQYAFGTSRDPENILSFSPPQKGSETFEVLLSTNIQRGLLYLATVKVCNAAGRCISITSDGIKFGNPPQIQSVIDGFNELDIDQQTNSSQLCGSWSNVSDDGFPVVKYSVAFLACDSDQVPQFVNVGLKEEFCFQNLALKMQTAYCIILRATNIAGLTSEARSDGVMVCGPPSTQLASVRHDIFFSGVGALHVSWSGFHQWGSQYILYHRSNIEEWHESF